MIGLGVFLIALLLIVKLVAAIFGVAFEVTGDIIKLGLGLIVIGVIVDVLLALTGRRSVYSRFRR